MYFDDLSPLDVPGGTTPDAMPPNPEAVAAAVERRIRQERLQSPPAEHPHTSFDHNHEKRQEFRRLIDPGILRPNAREIALEALQTLKQLADNIIKHPNDEKYYKFKPTNSKIKHLLVEPKGTLEYAVALGFHPKVENFQPYYMFNPRHMSDLRIGSAMLEEALERELSKEERARHAREAEKAASEAAVANIKQAFLDDRRSRALQARRERETREAIEAAARRRASLPPASPPTTQAWDDASGRTLQDDADTGSPPPYV
ncbi:hypothetical protein BKA93DRAFT_757832 [Sparassis latifolia]